MGFGPRIVGQRVVLRSPLTADREARRAFGRHEEIQRMYGVATPTTGPWTDDDAERWFHRLGTGDTIEWVIDADERLLGATRLTFDGPSSAKYAIGFFDRLDSAKGSELR